MVKLTQEQLEELRQFDSPTISNAIESFNVRPRNVGFMGPEIKCIIPYDKPIVGYAATAKISANKPSTDEQNKMIIEYYKKVKATPNPTIAVIQDIDPKPVGSFWGDVHSSIHKALGCVGVVTNGGVRDIDGVKELGFGFFAGCVLVSHAYDHVEDYDCPVVIGGLTVHPGDLLHADKHGVVLIPEEVAPMIADACRKVQYYEEPLLVGCKARFDEEIEIEELIKLREEMFRRKES